MPIDSQNQQESEETWVEYPYPLFYPTAEKFGVAGGLILIPLVAILFMGISGVISGQSGAGSEMGGWLSVILLLVAVPIYVSGIDRYFCHLPLLTIPIVLLFSYFVACLVVGRKISNILIAIAFYLLLLAVVFKIMSFIYLPPACIN